MLSCFALKLTMIETINRKSITTKLQGANPTNTKNKELKYQVENSLNSQEIYRPKAYITRNNAEVA